jgi:CheY-like chemotaxis protein/anti-sigma regulatory factor (Ser/Thr protein kinase)
VLINFANNAVKFTDVGGIVIRVSKADETPQNVHVRFEVSDTGIGIPRDALDTLFEGFQQVANPAHRKAGGSGLGLAIAKRLAQAMGGQVGVESVEGKGSMFWFTVRLGKGRLPLRALVPSLDLRGLRVLVADDNETARTVLSEMLIHMSFDVDVVDSGAAAIAALQVAATGARPYALVFLDWRMPGMDGTETAMNIKALALNPRPPCIMVTGYGKEHVLSGAKLAHVDDLLIKPVDPSVLFDTVVRVLSIEDRLRASGSAEPGDDSLLTQLKGARVLVVEDNDVNAYLTKTLLENAGFVVDVAENGAIGLAKVKDNWYDLVFMDMQMPVMDGITATQEIRRIDRLSRLPIVAITANTSEDDRMRCLAAGMNDFLPKPLSPKGLWRTMLQWVTPRVRAVTPSSRNAMGKPEVANGLAPMDDAMAPRDATQAPDLSVVLDWLKRHLIHEDPAALELLIEHKDLLVAQLGPHYAALLASVEGRAFNAARQQLATVLQLPAG